jgi:hypothetical protein
VRGVAMQCSNTEVDFLFSVGITINNSKNDDESNGDDYDNVADNKNKNSNNKWYRSKLICIQEVLGSNLGRDTLTKILPDFPQSIQAVTASFHILSNSIFINHPII